ncbi:tetratricopeptide repeat protein [Actinomadura macrotermitis]|uniref:Tetratricopeptide repeat protein n=1 Tax=Actinomadura macrotermitis TaxID=2585200 RepID=A0A7K0C4J2_9ACTN|nr:tetratricopeptide repeat protein [Actinomadura macrotermitis]MQY07734.1 hypothetical protein [Actinomadura macrotermitis]
MSRNNPLDPAESDLLAAARGGDLRASVRYAELLCGRRDIDGALPWLEAPALAGDGHAARTLAIIMRTRGEHEHAERWYRAAADRDGGCAFGLADLLDKSGDLAGALEWYDRGAALGSLECKTNGALRRLEQGEVEAAEALREAAAEGDEVAAGRLGDMAELADELKTLLGEVRADTDAEYVLDLIGGLDERPERFRAFPHLLDDALKVYDAAAEVVGDDRPAVWKALLLDKLGHVDEACQVLGAAVQRHPEEGYAARVLGLTHLERGDLDAAGEALRVSAERGYLPGMWSLALHRLRLRDLDGAQEWFGRYREAGGDNDAGAQLARVAELRAAPDNVLSAEDEARLPDLRVAADAGDAAAAFELGGLLRDRHDLAEAVRRFRAAAGAGDLRAREALARLLWKHCGSEARHVLPLAVPAAEAAYPRAFAAPVADPADVTLVEWTGRLYLDEGDDFLAERWLRRAARLGHGNAAWWAGNRSDTPEHGDPQEAERMWTLAARRGVPWCGWLAGRAMVRRGAHAEAEPLLRTAYAARAEQEPLHEAAYWLGLALRGQGRTDEAAQWLRTAVDVHPHVLKGYTGFMRTSLFDPREPLAEVLYELGRDAEAQTLVEEILRAHPRHRIGALLTERRGRPAEPTSVA